MFTVDKEIIDKADDFSTHVILIIIFDYLRQTLYGTVKALNLDRISAKIQFATHWVVILPLCYYYTFCYGIHNDETTGDDDRG